MAMMMGGGGGGTLGSNNAYFGSREALLRGGGGGGGFADPLSFSGRSVASLPVQQREPREVRYTHQQQGGYLRGSSHNSSSSGGMGEMGVGYSSDGHILRVAAAALPSHIMPAVGVSFSREEGAPSIGGGGRHNQDRIPSKLPSVQGLGSGGVGEAGPLAPVVQ